MLTILKNELEYSVIARALLALFPIITGFLWSGNEMLWNVGLVTMSLLIATERLKLGITAITAHFLLITLGFSLLFWSFLIPYLFIVLCASMAFATIYFTRHGDKLRTLTNYTFIPILYLTCELHEGTAHATSLAVYLKFIKLIPIAWLSVVIIYGAYHLIYRNNPPMITTSQLKSPLQKLLRGAQLGNPEIAWRQGAFAIFFGVALASTLVIFLHISRGEWMIWSVASVITIEFSSAKTKFKNRFFGACVGVPLGFFIAQFVPKTETIYSLAALAIVLTLVAFKRYRVAFTCRCLCVAVAAYVASSTPLIALERIENVIIGGIIGLTAAYLAKLIFEYFQDKSILKLKCF